MQTQPTFERIVSSADGTHIYTDAVGDSSNPAVVFIHGYCLSSVVYDNIFSEPLWRDNLFLVRLDMRGHGRSDKPQLESDWTPKKFAEDFEAVVRTYRLRKPFIAAWSSGGTMVADILTFHPSSSLSGILYITPIPFLGFLDKIATDYVLGTLPKLLQTKDVDDFQIGARGFVQGMVSPENRSNKVAFPPRLQHACLGDMMSLPRSCRIHALQRSQDEFGLMRAGRRGLPVLLINGKHDMLLNGQPLLGLFGKWRNLHIVEMDTGHMPWWEAPKVFNDAALVWISKVLSGGVELEANL